MPMLNAHSHRNWKQGFTLIELTVVIAIIVMLALLTTASFSTIRAKAGQANCASNLRQIGIGFLAYNGENNGSFPPHWGADQNGDVLAWYGFVAPYIVDWKKPTQPMDKIFHCPSNPRPYNTSMNYLSETKNVDQSYGYNYYYLTSNPSWALKYRAAAIANKTKFVLVGDIPTFGDNNDIVPFGGSFSGLRLYPSATASYGALMGVSKRHGKGANFLFLDGHVEHQNSQSFARDKFNNVNWIPSVE